MTHSYQEDDRYDWKLDGYRSWAFAISMKALEIGARRAASCWEFYWLESHGGIP